MRTSTLMLSVALAASVATAGWLWRALDAERARNAAHLAHSTPDTTAPVPAITRTDVEAKLTTPPAERARWQSYIENLGSRRRVESLRTQLAAGDPLRDDQFEPLIAALGAETLQYHRELDDLVQSMAADTGAIDQQRRYMDHKVELLK